MVMIQNKDDVMMINTWPMRITGVYQMATPKSRKVFGYNVYKCICVIQLIVLITSIFVIPTNIKYFLSDLNEITKYMSMTMSSALVSIKLYTIIQNAHRIWHCIQLTSIDSLSYKYHSKQLFAMGEKRSKTISTIFIVLWVCLALIWILGPLPMQNISISVVIKNEIRHYRYNVLNLIYPVSDRFYNEHFVMHYILETTIVLIWTNVTIIFEILLITLCIKIKFQLKSIVNSNNIFNIEHCYLTDEKTNTSQYKEQHVVQDFKILVNDQQKVLENIRIINQIFRPVIFSQTAMDSFVVIFLSSITIINYIDGVPLLSVLIVKPIITTIIYIFHLYFYCYLYDSINEQRDSLNFAIYCINWTKMSLKFKKLLLYTMRMNDANNDKLHITLRNVINMEMFAIVMRNIYSILSILANKYKMKTK